MAWEWSSLAIDRGEHERACLELLRDLIRIDTSNPPGRERAAAQMLADRLRAGGLEPRLLETGPERACVVTRLRGRGEAPPLLLNAHLDVVPADASEWTVPPFAGEIRDGYLWGRGAIDMKNMAAMVTTVMTLLKRLQVPLRRDVIFAAVADEEAGCDHGSMWLVDHEPELVRAEYALGEVGGFSYRFMGRTFYPIMVAEKGVCWVKATARGRSGHGSIPNPDSATHRLARALAQLGQSRLPVHATRAVTRFTQGLAEQLPFPMSRLLPLVTHPKLAYKLLDRALSEPERSLFAANLANTANPTVLRAGRQINVVPGSASVEIDGRTLPGQSAAAFLDELGAVLGPGIDLEVLRWMPAVETTSDSPLFEHLARTIERHDPGSFAIPYMLIGFSDAKAYSRLGTRCYGFAPVRFAPDAPPFSTLFHGADERIPVDGLAWGLGVLWDAVTGFCSFRPRKA